MHTHYSVLVSTRGKKFSLGTWKDKERGRKGRNIYKERERGESSKHVRIVMTMLHDCCCVVQAGYSALCHVVCIE